MIRRAAGAAALMAALGCAGSPGVAAAPAVTCPPVDTLAGRWRVTVILDGRRIADGLRARRTQDLPETFELDQPEPAELAALPPERIDLIQFARGPDPERDYRLCPAGVALLVTTRPTP